MKDKDFLQSYMHMIASVLEFDYETRYEEGMRAIVFCSTVDMCTKVTEYLKKRLPNRSVKRFVGGDPKSNLYEPDIRVTTPGSGGTAHDIKNLMTTVNSVAIYSIQQVIQMLGRLRKLPNMETHYLYLTCTQIPKHRNYNRETIELFRKRCATVKIQNYASEV